MLQKVQTLVSQFAIARTSTFGTSPEPFDLNYRAGLSPRCPKTSNRVCAFKTLKSDERSYKANSISSFKGHANCIGMTENITYRSEVGAQNNSLLNCLKITN